MGNQHQIIQTEPFKTDFGAAIKIQSGKCSKVHAIYRSLENKCYTYIQSLESNEVFEIGNLDGPDEKITGSGDYLVIQSGGKMWCGYENFISAIENYSQFLEEAIFYVGDEYAGFVDEFVINGERLEYMRLDEGYVNLDEYLKDYKSKR